MALIFQTSIEQTDPPRSPRETLPTMYDLPSEDPEEPGLPDEFHDLQPQLLSRTLRLTDYAREQYFTASDLNLYYDVKHALWHKRPDWFLVVDVPHLYEGKDLRRSYVIWQEGRHPDIVVEFLSPGTEREDLGRFYDASAQVPDPGVAPLPKGEVIAPEINELSPGIPRRQRAQPPAKFEVYEQYLRVPHYIVYSRYTQCLRHFQLVGKCYQEQALQADNPRIWIDDLGMGLGIWDGIFADVPSHWLRWCDREGRWFLTDTEQAEQERDRAEQERDRVQTQLHQAVQNLLASGMEISQVAAMLGLSGTQVQALTPRD